MNDDYIQINTLINYVEGGEGGAVLKVDNIILILLSLLPFRQRVQGLLSFLGYLQSTLLGYRSSNIQH